MIREDVFLAVKKELEVTEGTTLSESLLQSKVDSAIADVKAARDYPASYSESKINADLERYFSAICRIALYDYNQVGAEGQSSYSADGTSIHYINRNSLFKGIVAIAGV